MIKANFFLPKSLAVFVAFLQIFGNSCQGRFTPVVSRADRIASLGNLHIAPGGLHRAIRGIKPVRTDDRYIGTDLLTENMTDLDLTIKLPTQISLCKHLIHFPSQSPGRSEHSRDDSINADDASSTGNKDDDDDEDDDDLNDDNLDGFPRDPERLKAFNVSTETLHQRA